MEISFATSKLQTLCSSQRELRRKLGPGGARKAMAHIASLQAASVLEELRSLPGRCHELVADRAGQLALELPDGKRLIFRPAENPVPRKPDGGLDWAQVRAVELVEIDDYH